MNNPQDTNVGLGMVQDTPEEKRIAELDAIVNRQRAELSDYAELAQTISADNDGLWLGDSPDDHVGHIGAFIGKLEALNDNRQAELSRRGEIMHAQLEKIGDLTDALQRCSGFLKPDADDVDSEQASIYQQAQKALAKAVA